MKIKAQIDRMIGENNRIKAYASVILGANMSCGTLQSWTAKTDCSPECHIAAIRIGTAI